MKTPLCRPAFATQPRHAVYHQVALLDVAVHVHLRGLQSGVFGTALALALVRQQLAREILLSQRCEYEYTQRQGFREIDTGLAWYTLC
jgi:hypothetical protein